MRAQMGVIGGVLACGLVVAALTGIEARQVSAAKHVVVPADKVAWTHRGPGFPTGMKIAVIDGDPNAESGWYVIRLQFPDGYKFPPHFHPQAENLTVLSGTFILGMGGQGRQCETGLLRPRRVHVDSCERCRTSAEQKERRWSSCTDRLRSRSNWRSSSTDMKRAGLWSTARPSTLIPDNLDLQCGDAATPLARRVRPLPLFEGLVPRPAVAQRLANPSFQIEVRRERHSQSQAHGRRVRHGLHRRQRRPRPAADSVSHDTRTATGANCARCCWTRAAQTAQSISYTLGTLATDACGTQHGRRRRGRRRSAGAERRTRAGSGRRRRRRAAAGPAARSRDVPIFTWAGSRGATQWVQYTFPGEENVSTTDVFWTIAAAVVAAPLSGRRAVEGGRAREARTAARPTCSRRRLRAREDDGDAHRSDDGAGRRPSHSRNGASGRTRARAAGRSPRRSERSRSTAIGSSGRSRSRIRIAARSRSAISPCRSTSRSAPARAATSTRKKLLRHSYVARPRLVGVLAAQQRRGPVPRDDARRRREVRVLRQLVRRIHAVRARGGREAPRPSRPAATGGCPCRT